VALALLTLALLTSGLFQPVAAQGGPAPSSRAEVDALLDALAARYANARSYRDVGYGLWLPERELFRSTGSWAEWTLAFERGATGDRATDEPVVGREPAESADARWLVEERRVGRWGVASLKILWADGPEFRTWTSKGRTYGRSDAGLQALAREREHLPLRLALRDGAREPDPFAALTQRTSLGEADVNGARCLGVELREGERDHFALRLWIAADDHSLRRLEYGVFESSDGGYHTEVTYHPRFDAPLPADALAFDPPWPLFAVGPRDVSASAVLIGWGAALAIVGLIWWRRRRPWLLGRSVLLLSLFCVQSARAFEFFAAWLRLPAELDGRVLEVPWPQLSMLALLIVAAWFMLRGEWSAIGVSSDPLRAALEALVKGRGGDPQWTRARRSWGSCDVLELPESELHAELSGAALRLRGRAARGERSRWRRAVEEQLAHDGVVTTAAVPLLMSIVGGTVFALGVGMFVL